MNFLAHLYLSGQEPEHMVGNFIGDFVKGRELAHRFQPGIVKGIGLHRAIDSYTDAHPVVRQSKKRLSETYRHYSGVITDVFYDHFLASQWSFFSDEPLDHFAQRSYALLLTYETILPEEVKYMMPHMMKGNWLLNYQHLDGIARALLGMSRRTTFQSKMEQAVGDLKTHYDLFGDEFQQFFPELKSYCDDWIAHST
jgi:acyl carrier protein phosphodiesterase